MAKKTYIEFDKALDEISSIVELAGMTGYFTLSKPDEQFVNQKSFVDAYEDSNGNDGPKDMVFHIVNTFWHSLRWFLMAFDYDDAAQKKTWSRWLLFLLLAKQIMEEIKEIQPMADSAMGKQFVIDLASLINTYANKYSTK